MIEINPESLTTAKHWNAPTTATVASVLEAIEKKHGVMVADLLGIGDRTVRRWRVGANDTESSIPFGCWVVLVWISTGKVIIETVKLSKEEKAEIEALPQCGNALNWQPPSAAVVTHFIGKTSFTKLTRREIASRFKWSSENLGRQIAGEKLNFINWVCLMLLVGIKPKFIF